jgi:hypothetical protein
MASSPLLAPCELLSGAPAYLLMPLGCLHVVTLVLCLPHTLCGNVCLMHACCVCRIGGSCLPA